VNDARPWFGGDGGPPPFTSEGVDVEAHPVPPPAHLLAVAAGLIVAGLALWVPGWLTAHVGGYLVAMVGGLGTVAAFKRQDNQRRQNVFYSPNPRLRPAVPILALLAVASAMVNAWAIATHLAS
jgi:hypothetical protein